MCMGNPQTNKEWKNTSQRYAVCLSLEKKRHKKAKGSEDVEEILDWEDVEKQIKKDGAIII